MDRQLKCLILDDELPGLAYLRMLCEQFPGVEVVRAFNDPLQLIEYCRDAEFDLCILDIEMPGLNGLEVAHLLAEKPVIFTSAYKEYASEAFNIDAVDYIVKPVHKDRLERALEKAAALLEKNRPVKQFVQLNTNKGRTIVFFDQLLLIRTSETDARDKIAYLADGSRLVLKNITFTQLLAQLPEALFCRTSKKEVIALKAISYFSHDEITTVLSDKDGNPERISLSELYRKELARKINE